MAENETKAFAGFGIFKVVYPDSSGFYRDRHGDLYHHGPTRYGWTSACVTEGYKYDMYREMFRWAGPKVVGG